MEEHIEIDDDVNFVTVTKHSADGHGEGCEVYVASIDILADHYLASPRDEDNPVTVTMQRLADKMHRLADKIENIYGTEGSND